MLPLERVWAVLNPSVTVHSPKPVMGHRLVKLKTFQQPDPRKAKNTTDHLYL
jgi:hypothetical protein